VPQPRTLPYEPNSVSRNARCPCGSGLKYKRCCGTSRKYTNNFEADAVGLPALNGAGAAATRAHSSAVA